MSTGGGPGQRFDAHHPRAAGGAGLPDDWSELDARLATRLGAAEAPGPAWYYAGRRASATEVHVVTRSTVQPLEHRAHLSSAPFDWGRHGEFEGACELAYALLVDVTAGQPPLTATLAFTHDVVRALPVDGFVLGAGDVERWLELAHIDAAAWPWAARPDDGEARQRSA